MKRETRAIALHLAAWARDELDAQREALGLLSEQETAVRARDLGRLDVASAALSRHAERGAARARRRDALLGELATHWGVARTALTLGSVVERLGAEGAELAPLRAELRAGAADVLRASRRVGALVNAFRRVAGEVVELVLTDGGEAPIPGLYGGGALVDAEA